MSRLRGFYCGLGVLLVAGCVLDDPYFIDQDNSLAVDDRTFPEGDDGAGSGASSDTSGSASADSDDLGGPTDDSSPADDNSPSDDNSTAAADDSATSDDSLDDAQSDADAGVPASASETDDDDALAAAVCGDGAKDVGEECDRDDLNGASCASLASSAFSGGALACSDTCEFDTSDCESAAECGNSVLEAGEECDSLELGGQSCGRLGYSGGRLSCDSGCELDESDCTVGQDCDAVLNTPLGLVYQGNTEDRRNSTSDHSCAPLGGRGGDLSLAWTAPEDGCYAISITSDEDMDTIASVHTSCDLDDELACDNNSGIDQLSVVEFDAVANTTYALVIDSFYSIDEGAFAVSVSPCAPREWTCPDEKFDSGDGCDCGCGLLDPDCTSESSNSCELCDASGSCASQCSEISEESNWECQTGGGFGGGTQGGGNFGGGSFGGGQ